MPPRPTRGSNWRWSCPYRDGRSRAPGRNVRPLPAPAFLIKGRQIRLDIKKIVLAYSGGLDTSIMLKWLQEHYEAEIVTFTADLGQGEELEPARKKAEMFGIKDIRIVDVREEFVRDFVFPMFRANALYEGQYLLGTSIARPVIAKHLVEIAAKPAPTRSPMAPPARATTRCASS
jgi:hypothetical protein